MADWSDLNKDNCYTYWNCRLNKKEVFNVSFIRTNQTYMSKQSAEYMLSNVVSEADFKLFLGIVD